MKIIKIYILLLMTGGITLFSQSSIVNTFNIRGNIFSTMTEGSMSYFVSSSDGQRVDCLQINPKTLEVKSEIRIGEIYESSPIYFDFRNEQYILSIEDRNGMLTLIKLLESNNEILLDTLGHFRFPEYKKFRPQTPIDDVWVVRTSEKKNSVEGLISFSPTSDSLFNLSFEIDSLYNIRFDTSEYFTNHINRLEDLVVYRNSRYISSKQGVFKFNSSYALLTGFNMRGYRFSQGGHLHFWHDKIISNTYYSPFSSFDSTIETYVLDTNLQLIDHWTTGIDTMINFPAWSEPFCEVDSQSLLMAGNIGEYYGYLEPEGEFGSYICSYDENLDTNWLIVIFEEGSSIALMGLYKANNGNVIAYGRKRVRNENWTIYPILIEISPDGTFVNSTSPISYQQESFMLYPNPVHDVFRIKLESLESKKEVEEIRIMNLKGQLLASYPFKPDQLEEQIHIGHLPSGQYYISLLSEKGIIGTKKLIKQ
jgi:hypothetical protein